MRFLRLCSTALLCACATGTLASGETFVTFPNKSELASPDQRYVLRTIDPVKEPADFTGTFHCLVLENRDTGQKRRLFDYVHRIAVAWSGGRIIATDYFGRKGSRALVFSVDPKADGYVVDRDDLAGRVPALGVHLRQNDHVFIEAVRVEGELFVLRVWGYGGYDRSGFRFGCTLNLVRGTASCEELVRTTPP